MVSSCHLSPFPGASGGAIELHDVSVDVPDLPELDLLVDAAWCVVLYLYTGIQEISFESVARGGTTHIRACNVREDDLLKAIVERLASEVDAGRQYEFNTATVFRLGDQTSETDNKAALVLLHPGLQAILQVCGAGSRIVFRRSLMSDDEATNLAATFAHVFRAFSTPPRLAAQRIRDITISSRDLDQNIAWNKGGRFEGRKGLLQDQFADIVQAQPNADAIDSWDGRMTYQELDETSAALAVQLQQLGVGPGSWVLFSFHKSRWAVVSILGILRAGAAAVALDPRHPANRVGQIIRTTGADHVLVGSRGMAELLASVDPHICIVHITSQQNTVIQGGGKTKDVDNDPGLIMADSPAMGIFTSGSTGTPKGIVLTHAGLSAATAAYAASLGVDTGGRVLQFSSYTFDISIADIFTALLHGAVVCIPSEQQRVDALQEYIAAARPTWAVLTPTVARLLDQAAAASTLRTLALTGEAARDSDIAGWIEAGVALYNIYGPAENTLVTTMGPMQLGRPACNIGSGVNTSTWVADVTRERLVPTGAVGELVIEGPHVSPGYINDSDTTCRAFFDGLAWIPTGYGKSDRQRHFYRTRDLVRRCADGSLLYIGRADSQVKLGGQRVELRDIEAHIRSDAVWAEAANIVVVAPRRGPMIGKLVAVVQEATKNASGPSESSRLSLAGCGAAAAEAAGRLRERLPPYMIPSVWLAADRFPISVSGKLDRRTLGATLEGLSQDEYVGIVSTSGVPAHGNSEPEVDERQQLLRRVCAEVLNLPAEVVSMRQRFTGLGGDSITAMKVSHMVRRVADQSISVHHLLACPSLADAAACMTDLSPARVELPPVPPGQQFGLSPIQRLFFDTARTAAVWNRYHQSVVLRLREQRDERQVRCALAKVIERHPMLRARFQQQPDGSWQQYLAGATREPVAPIESYPASVGPAQRATLMLQARGRIDITHGPLLRAQLFEAGPEDHAGGPLLFIVCHHLVMDLVSWRVILEELEIMLTRALNMSADEEHRLLAPYRESTAFSTWVELQARAASTIRPELAIPARPPLPDPNFEFWGVKPSMNYYGQVREQKLAISEATTGNLLYHCHEPLRTEPADILAASLLLSFRRAFPDRTLPAIFAEGHGREPWDDSLDVARTVGWFTTMAPVCVDDSSAADAVALVARVKDYRRSVRNHGFDYFSAKYLTNEGRLRFGSHLPAEVLFNYEGRYQSMEREEALLAFEGRAAGETLADSSPDLLRFSIFEIAAAVLPDGQLHITSAWNTASRHQERITAWLTVLLPAALEEVVLRLMLLSERCFTLSDIELAGLADYAELDALIIAVKEIPGVRSLDDVEGVYRGSPMQEALALSRSRLGDGVYEVDIIWEVTANPQAGVLDPVDHGRLVVAWRNTVARHAALRTVILEAAAGSGSDAGMVHQVILRKYEPPCIVVTDAKDAAHAKALLAGYPPLGSNSSSKLPPHRLLISQVTNGGRTFARLQVNHLVFDGTSVQVLLRDLSRAYYAGSLTASLGGGAEAHGDQPLNSLGDFIRYIRQPSRRKASIIYWKDLLTGFEPCRFPSLRDENPEPESDPEEECALVPVPLNASSAELRHFVTSLGVTLPALFQLVWALTLRVYTSGKSTVFGCLVSGRDAPVNGIEDAVGIFIAMLICIVNFSDEHRSRSVADVMRDLHLQTAQSMAHQASSLPEIHRVLGLQGDSPLFDTSIIFGPIVTKDTLAGQGSALLFDPQRVRDPTEFSLTLFVETAEDACRVILQHRKLTIGPGHAANIACTISAIVSRVLACPDAAPNALLSPSDRDLQSIWAWNKTLAEPCELGLDRVFARTVAAYGDRDALNTRDGTLTYNELDSLSGRLAYHLLALGVGPEVVVPICMEKSTWPIVSALAVLRAGGCFALMDPAIPEERLRDMVDAVDASLLLCSPLARRSRVARLQQAIAAAGRNMHVLEIGPGFVESLPALEANWNPCQLVCDTVRPDHALYVTFTSGSTGKPKGIVLTHRSLATGLGELAQATGVLDMGPKVRAVQFSSFSFDVSVGEIFITLSVGGCLCIPNEEDRDPVSIAAFIRRSRANWACLTPSFSSLVDPSSVPCLETLCFVGEVLPASQVHAWAGRLRLINAYGPSECAVLAVASGTLKPRSTAPPIGRAFRGLTWIVDEFDHERLQPIGVAGELLIEGPIIARGYLKSPDASARVFIDAPSWLRPTRPSSRLYKTGDLVRYGSDGTIHYLGRKDTQVKVNGQRVELAEIELRLRAAAEPSDVTITVELLKRQHLREGDLLVAFVHVGGGLGSGQEHGGSGDMIATDRSMLAKLRDLVAKIRHRLSTAALLPEYMTPRAYVPLRQLPLSPSGKVDRHALQRASASLSRDQLVGFTQDHTSLDLDSEELLHGGRDGVAQLARLWEKVLQIRVSGRHSNFFRLGGDSLAAMALRAEAHRAGLQLSVSDIFTKPVLSDMAGFVYPSASLASLDSLDSLGSLHRSSELPSTISEPSEALQPRQVPRPFAEVGDTVEPFSLLQKTGLDAEAALEYASRMCSLHKEEIEDVYPCTPMQEALLASSSGAASSRAYAMHAPFRLGPSLDADQLAAAWEQTMRLHSILRSYIVARAQGSLVVVVKSAASVNRMTGRLGEYVEEQEQNGFPHGSPLTRMAILHDSEDGCRYFIFSAHHAAYDAWSLNLIWDTVLALYHGAPAPRSGPPPQSFARELGLISTSQSETFWKSCLSEPDGEAPQFPIIPTFHKPITHAASSFCFPFHPESLVATVATAADLINAAWAMTVCQYCASSTVTFGVTLSGRDIALESAELVVAPLITTVPRRLIIDYGKTLSSFVEHVHGTSAAAIAHQHTSLDAVRRLGHAARRACQFGSLLVIQTSDMLRSSLEAAGIIAVPTDSVDMHPYPLVLECLPRHGTLAVRAAFDPSCIDQTMLGHVAQQFCHNLQLVSKSLHLNTAMGTLLGDIATSHLDTMLDWNGGGDLSNLPDPVKMSLVHEQVANKAEHTPSTLAVIAHDQSLTFAELQRQATWLARKVRSAASPDTQFVGICFEHSAAPIVAMLAIFQAGFAFVPLDPEQPLARLEDVAVSAAMKMVLTSPLQYAKMCQLPVPSKNIILVDLAVLAAEQQQAVNDNATSLVKVQAGEPAYVLFTSGTTGKPKGVITEHGALACSVASLVAYFGLSPGTRMLQFSSYGFDMCILEIFDVLCAGGCVCVASEYDRMNNLAGYMRAKSVNSFLLTPTVARLLDPAALPAVRTALLGGEALTKSDLDRWRGPGRRSFNIYGPTEACVIQVAREAQPDVPGIPKKRGTNLGWPVGAGAWVVSPATGNLAPVGAVGELCIEGPTLARGYLGDAARTATSFVHRYLGGRRRRVYRSGDLVRYTPDGSIEYLGRRDKQVKLRGQRLELGDVESAIQKAIGPHSPGIRQVSVQLHVPSRVSSATCEPFLVALFGSNDMPTSERIGGISCSLLLPSPEGSKGNIAVEVQTKLRGMLPSYMVPTMFIAFGQLPVTTSGKLDRPRVAACIDHLATKLHTRRAIFDASLDAVTPDAELELVREWWSSVLGVDKRSVGPGDNFFVLGGSSITAIRLVGLALSSGFRLSYDEVFAFPTLSAMTSRMILSASTNADCGSEKPTLYKPFELVAQDELESVFQNLLLPCGIERDQVEDMYPCLPLQEMLMAATSRYRGAYTVVEEIEVPISLSERLKNALELAVRTFDILRTRIVLRGEGDALQVVLKANIQVFDWEEVPDIETFARHTYDSHGYAKPLVHLARVRCTANPETVRFCFAAHHSLYDGWSLAIIWQLIRQHVSLVDSEPSGDQGMPFKLFVRHALGRGSTESIEFWRETLSAVSSSAFPRRPHDISPAYEPIAASTLARAAKNLPSLDRCGAKATTLATAAQAAWALTISHYTANCDVVFGSTISGRESAAAALAGVETVAGPTITTIPFRTIINYSTSVADFLGAVQQRAVQVAHHAHIGLERISRINRDCQRASQLDNILVIQPPAPEIDDEGSRSGGIVRRTIDTGGFYPGALVMVLQFSNSGSQVVASMSYDSAIILGDMPWLILDTYMTILRGLLGASPESPLRDVPALSLEHANRVSMAAQPGKDSIEEARGCLHDLVYASLKAEPQACAIEAWDGSLTYVQLDELSTRLAWRLRSFGIVPETAVCHMFDKSKWAVIAMLAISKAGGCFVPLDPQHPPQRLEHMARVTAASAVVASSQHAGLAATVFGGYAKLIVVGDGDEAAAMPRVFTELPPLAEPRNAAYILFTSGSTGVPKGVVVEHRSLCSTLLAIGRRMGLGPQTRAFQFSSYSFDVMIQDIFATLAYGGCVCIPSEHQRMNDLAGTIERLGANTTFFTPTVLRLLSAESVPSLRTISLGGEAVASSDMDRWASRVRLVAGYGPTEACIFAAMGDLAPGAPFSAIGTAVNCRAWVVNPVKETELAPLGAVGELFIQGPNVARGYIGVDNSVNAGVFLMDPAWLRQPISGTETMRIYKTGDLVYFDTAAGALCFVGRKDAGQVKLHGKRVELAEIEEAIRKLVPSHLTPVSGVFPLAGGKQVLAAGIAGCGTDVLEPLARHLSAELPQLLPKYMIPDVFVPLTSVPLQTAGKLDRDAASGVMAPLVASMHKRELTPTTALPQQLLTPATKEESLLWKLWARVLQLQAQDEQHFSRTSSFFRLGGDSITAMRLVALLRHEGFILGVVDIFANPSLSAMAAAIVPASQPAPVARNDMTRGQEATQCALTREVLDTLRRARVPITPDEVEGVQACTSMQEMFLSGTMAFPGAHVVHFSFNLDGRVDIPRLRRAFARCADWFPVLRSRVVHLPGSGQIALAVLRKGAQAPLHCLPYSRSRVMLSESEGGEPFDLGDTLHRIVVVEDSLAGGPTRLTWILNHAAYDAWSLGMMLATIEKVYSNPDFQLFAVGISFEDFVNCTAKENISRDPQGHFWDHYLPARKLATPLLFNYASVKEPRQDQRASYQLVLPDAAMSLGSTTTTAPIIAAWILLISQLTGTHDIAISYLVSGRNAKLAGIERCPGPTITKVPLRIRLPQGHGVSPPTLSHVTTLVSNELLRIMPHEQAALATLMACERNSIAAKSEPNGGHRPLLHGAALLGRFPLDLAIHPANYLDTALAGGSRIGMRFKEHHIVTPAPGPLSVECSILSRNLDKKEDGIRVELTIYWDSRAAHQSNIDSLVHTLEDIFIGMATGSE